jgi:acetylornithine deacetylase/succinyl-diaminopimelate desuccinylase-like protein
MAASTVVDFIDPEAIARDTLEFLRVRSETGTEGPGSEFLAALMRREGLDAELEEVERDRPNVTARMAGASDGRVLVFNGHTDTIPVGVSTPPGRDGDWVIGRGAEDMKGGLVAMVHAASALKRAAVEPPGDVYLTGVIGHEAPAGRKEGPKRLIRHLRDRTIPADAVIIVEGPCAIWSASLGSTIYHVTISSDRGPVHTIKVPFAQNPARWAGRLLERFAELEQEFESGPSHELCGRERLNVGIVSGGDYMNRLPTPVHVTGTWRWVPGKTRGDVERTLDRLCSELARDSGLDFEWRLDLASAREPFETPAGHPVVTTIQAAVEHLTGRPAERIGMGLVGDANLYSNDGGVPTVYYGPAHETAHSDHERVSISQLAHCAKVYALTMASFGRR